MTIEMLAVAGAAVILVLAVVAGYYLWQVKQLNQHQQQQREQLEQERRVQREKTVKSLKLISNAILEDQLTLTEGALRIRAMLLSLNVDDSVLESFSAFFLLAEATQHIPILEEWKKLDRKQQFKFDRQREKLESDHREFVLDAAKRLRQHNFTV